MKLRKGAVISVMVPTRTKDDRHRTVHRTVQVIERFRYPHGDHTIEANVPHYLVVYPNGTLGIVVQFMRYGVGRYGQELVYEYEPCWSPRPKR